MQQLQRAKLPQPVQLTPIPLYGRIPSGQNVPTGAYVDIVTATVTY